MEYWEMINQLFICYFNYFSSDHSPSFELFITYMCFLFIIKNSYKGPLHPITYMNIVLSLNRWSQLWDFKKAGWSWPFLGYIYPLLTKSYV